jgi:hypothetical protein
MQQHLRTPPGAVTCRSGIAMFSAGPLVDNDASPAPTILSGSRRLWPGRGALLRSLAAHLELHFTESPEPAWASSAKLCAPRAGGRETFVHCPVGCISLEAATFRTAT